VQPETYPTRAPERDAHRPVVGVSHTGVQLSVRGTCVQTAGMTPRSGAKRNRVTLWMILCIVAQGCSCEDAEERREGNARDAGSGDGGLVGADGGPTVPAGALDIAPRDPVLTVSAGDPMPSVQFAVTRDATAVSPSFTVDQGELGAISADGLFVANGSAGGTLRVSASLGDETVSTTVTVAIEATQNGGVDDGSGASSGGYGGVGGEGPGGEVDDATRAVLDADPVQDAELSFLYPYDGTVFALDLLPPLLQWSEGGNQPVDGIKLTLSGQHYEYVGYFGRPAPLAAGAPLVRHPIPRDVWRTATRSVRGGQLTVELTVASGGQAYGPISQTWTIANGSLQGTVYYQSYGTSLAKNYEGAIGGDGRFGGATLAIRPGDTGPTLVAGGDGGHDQCRVCHSVAADGARMTVQQGTAYDTTSSYDLLGNYAETPYVGADALLAWIGMTPDGSLGLGNARPLGVSNPATTQLYDMSSGAVMPTTGLSEFVTRAAFPAFSHQGDRVAFNFDTGPGDPAIGAGDGNKLVMMDFDGVTTFSNPQLLFEGDPSPGWPTFGPTGQTVVFQRRIAEGDGFWFTRYGGMGELWWTNLRTGESHALQRLNGTQAGVSYLPAAPNEHGTDQQLNYEPTVAPVAAGGYAWVVFMSRRLYGNVATIGPWQSDPREHDLVSQVTTKKLWVAAIDLNAEPADENDPGLGEDPSHPAFYLPGQELYAGNTRGFWVLDPCRDDGDDCESGVQCCSGYCQAEPGTETLTCGQKQDECAAELDRCDSDGDCCDPDQSCINDVCTLLVLE